MFILFWIDSNLSDGVGVVLKPEGKPPTQSQTWSNPRFNLFTWNDICCTSHAILHFKLLHCYIIAYLCITHFPETMAGDTASVEGMGEIITTVRLAFAGLCLVLSSSPRWGADECRLMILGVGGICQKSYLLLLPPSNMVGVDHPDCDAWELTFHLVLFAKIADTSSG